MGIADIILIGIGLSMDAFAVSICKGLKMKVIDFRQCFVIALFFGGFQAVMPLIGYALSINFVEYVNAYSHWVTLVLLVFIGANMIRESFGDREEDGCCNPAIVMKELITLAVATSIDALAVGVTFGTLGHRLQLSIWLSVLIIGGITFVLSIGGVFIGNVFGVKYKTKSEIAGGIILILIGIKVVLEHYL
ncbi:MAG: manganese efflux pump [Eubacterium sp.]|nr:manganese efflux pump [Eubacterium sp.]